MSQEDMWDPAAGRQGRDSALDLLERTRAAYIKAARATAVQISIRHGEVTSDAVREALPVPEGLDPRCLGPVFASAPPGFRWERTGYRQTRAKQAHARPISVWRLVNG